jgi:hypothetical protein
MGREGEVEKREVVVLEIQMREGEEEGRMGRWAGAPGARGPSQARPGRAGLGWVRPLRGSKPTTRMALKRAPIANQNPRRNETNTRHQTKKCASA